MSSPADYALLTQRILTHFPSNNPALQYQTIIAEALSNLLNLNTSFPYIVYLALVLSIKTDEVATSHRLGTLDPMQIQMNNTPVGYEGGRYTNMVSLRIAMNVGECTVLPGNAVEGDEGVDSFVRAVESVGMEIIEEEEQGDEVQSSGGHVAGFMYQSLFDHEEV